MANRFIQNPILTTRDIEPSQLGFVVECVLNPGVFLFEGKTWLLLRVAERPIQTEGVISLPILLEDGTMEILEFSKDDPNLDLSDARMVTYKGKTYLSTLSHLRLVCSDDGIHFHEPTLMPTKIFGKGLLETFGIEDCRVSFMDNIYNLTYTQVSENGVGVGLMQTRDWQHFDRIGMILPPHNKDCALFEEKIGGEYYCFHRPSGIALGGNFIWIASSPRLDSLGQTPLSYSNPRRNVGLCPRRCRSCAYQNGQRLVRNLSWRKRKQPLRARAQSCSTLMIPTKVLARSIEPLFEPTAPYELTGFFRQCCFY